MMRRAALGFSALQVSPQSIGSGRAMGLGFGAARALWPVVLLLGAARAAQGIVEASAGSTLLAVFLGDPAPAPAAGAWISAWLLSQLAASLVLALAAHAGAKWFAGSPPLAFPGSAYSSALAFFVAGGAVALTARLWTATALISTGIAYAGSLGAGRLAGLSSAALALALSLALFLGLAAAAWTRLALARAAVQSRGYLLSLFQSAATLVRAGAPWVVLAVAGIATWVFDTGLSGGLAILSPPLSSPDSFDFLWARDVAIAALAGVARGGIETWALLALVAFEISPKPPQKEARAEPIVQAEPVVQAEPIIDAEPVPGESQRPSW
jgi:hypothetical protein